MAEMSISPSSAGHVARGTAMELLELFVKYIVPLAGALAGFFAASALGGLNVVYGLMVQAFPMVDGTSVPGRVAAGTMALLWGAIGYGLWSIRRMDGIIAKLVGGALGGFFFGAALAQIPQLIQPHAAPDGALDVLVHGFQGEATAIAGQTNLG